MTSLNDNLVETAAAAADKSVGAVTHAKDVVAKKLRESAEAVSTTSEKIASHDKTVREYGQHAADWLDRSADRIDALDPQRVGRTLAHKVRRNVGPALVVASVAGLLVGLVVGRRTHTTARV